LQSFFLVGNGYAEGGAAFLQAVLSGNHCKAPLLTDFHAIF
jgi:hypothetical protein